MSPASKAAGAIYPFSGSKNLPLNDSKPTACLCLLKAKLLKRKIRKEKKE